MYNFGPYKGEQSITFPTDPQSRVMVVFGDNMRGKTSLLNSLRWVLYGKALDRHSNEVDLIKLMNFEAQREGEYKVWVHLHFEADGDDYELRRVAQPHDLIVTPRSKRDFRTEVLLRKNGSAVRADSVEHHINQFIPQEISRFYLFDSELLQEYETLLIEDSSQGQRIKESIEQILGVPALINGRDEIRDLLKKAQAVQAREARNVQALENLSQQSLQLQEEIKVHEEDVQEVEKKSASITDQIEKIDEELSQSKPAQETQRRIEELEGQERTLKSRQRDLETRKSEVLKGAWKDLLQPRLQFKRNEILRKIEQYKDKMRRSGAIDEKIAKLTSLLESSRCSLCGSDIDQRRREEFGSQLGQLKVEAEEMKFDLEAITSLTQEFNGFSKLSGTGAVASMRDIERQIHQTSIESTRIESELETLKERLRGHDVARIAQRQKEKEGLLELRGRCSNDIGNTRRLIEEKNNKVKQLSKLMSSNPEARKKKSSREVEIYTGLEQVFAKSVDLLRDRVREKVAYEATEVFKELTTEKTYRGLRINNNYGLTITDRNDEDVSVRSAGAEQIVAMSLLSALNKTAKRPGPVVIDTPFARLDPHHRLNIMKFVPRIAEQVVFLVHEGEINRENGLQPIAEHIGAVYEIERVSSSHSIITKIRDSYE
jgi:DNA sulfur modification protein DndD